MLANPAAAIPAGRVPNVNDYSLCAYTLVVEQDAIVSSRSHHGAIAVGGVLTDGTPDQSATVGGHSFAGTLPPNHEFIFAGGVTIGPQYFPFSWPAFERLAGVLRPSSEQETSGGVSTDATQAVHVVCRGGRYSISDFFANPPIGGGRSVLVVFNTRETVYIERSPSGRSFLGSILAPFSKVVLADDANSVDGFIVAKSFEMSSSAGSVELYGRCFSGSMACDATVNTASNCATSGGGSCEDAKGSRKCQRKAKKGKCSKKRKVREIHCRQACGTCNLRG